MRKILASAGLTAILGCASTHTIDTLADHLYEKGGIAVIDSRHLEELADEYTKKIEEQDNAKYRWLRYGLNLQLAKHTEQNEKYGKKCLEDAQQYMKFEPEDPTGYVLEAIAYITIDFYQHARQANKSLDKAQKLISEGKQLRLFKQEKIDDLHNLLKHEVYLQNKRTV